MSFRRRNKSAKVPNVKLRPPPLRETRGYPAPSTSRSLRAHDSGFDSEYDASLTDIRVPRPFRGVIISATGISDKTTLFKQAIELGAQPLNDLTDRVTHLLAIEPGSAKYHCALENKIPIMHPSWISDSYEIWLRGDDVDLQTSVQTYRLPIFDAVVLCISGIQDIEKRTEINRIVNQQGGSYVKNIERPVKVTHLLCTTGEDDMTEKMRYAAKFNKQKEANIRLVWEDWFWDSLRAKGRYNEDMYDISKPRPIRQSEFELADPPPPSSSPVIRDEGTPTSPVRVPKLLDNQGNEEETAVAVKRIPSVTLQIWKSMLQPRGFDIQQGKLIRSPSKSQALPNAHNTDLEDSPGGRPRAAVHELERARNNQESGQKGDEAGTSKQASILSSFRRSQSFMLPMNDASVPRQQPFQRISVAQSLPQTHNTADFATIDEGRPVASSSRDTNVSPDVISRQPQGLFFGITFRILGEAHSPSVRTALKDAGGRLVPDDSDESVDYIVVRLVSGSRLFHDEVDAQYRAKFRTECWLERCIFEERICAPDEHISFTPLKVALPVPGAEVVRLSVSGLDESELCWIRRLTRALGLNLLPNFSRRVTHLLCPSHAGAKFNKAQQWNIPVVDMMWLTEIAMSGRIPTVEDRQSMDATEYETGLSNLPIAERVREEPPVANVTNEHHAENESFGPPLLLVDTESADPAPLLPHTPDKTHSLKTIPLRVSAELESRPSRSYVSSTHSLQHEATMSFAELRKDMRNTRIPSSESPSPIKIISMTNTPNTPKKKPLRSNSNTPVKISKEATKILQESITSLLGKRNSMEEGSSGSVSVTRPKRMKPAHRSKPQFATATESIETVNSCQKSSLPGGNIAPHELAPPASYEPFGDPETSMLMAEGAPAMHDAVRVVYEDPAQSSERMRLMKLLEPELQAEQEQQGTNRGAPEVSEESSIPSARESAATKETRKRKPQPRRANTRIVAART